MDRISLITSALPSIDVDPSATIDIDQIVRSAAGSKARFIPRFVTRWLERFIHQDFINSYLIEGPEEIDAAWLKDIRSVGICGATSTPKWLMEQCRDYIINTI